MKKVLIVLQHLDVGGIESTILNICSHIDTSLYKVEIFCCDSQFMGKEKEFEKYKIYKAPYINSFKNIIAFEKILTNVLSSEKYDVVHSNMGIFDALVLKVAYKCKVSIRISHGHFRASQWGDKWYKQIIVHIARIIFKTMIKIYATACIACSKEANEYCFDGKGRVIYNGIDFEQYENCKGVHQGGPRVKLITVGRMSYAKNPLFIVDIINELVKIRQDIVFFWIGTGGMKKDIENRINNFGLKEYFEILGVRNDVSRILKENDYFLLPSLAEGLSMALLEAQVSGLDCFASDNVPADVNCGKVKFLPIGDAKLWAEEINKHISQEKWCIDNEKLSRFDIKYTIKQIEQVYDGRL